MDAKKRAQKFESYCEKENLTCFVREDFWDENQTVLFHSAFKIDDYVIPFAVIVDASVFTIIRVQLADNLVHRENQNAVSEYMDHMNRRYKVFKYLTSEDGTIFLDACLPAADDFLDLQLLRAILDVTVMHLTENYKDLLRAGGLLPKTRAN